MYYIFSIYNKSSGDYINIVDMYRGAYFVQNESMHTLSCDFSIIDSIVIGIFDDSDYSKEYYTLKDLIYIIQNYKVDIYGFSYSLISGKDLLIDNLDKIHIFKTIENPNKDFMIKLTKMKIFGNSHISLLRSLVGFNEDYVRNGIFYIPDDVINLDLSVSECIHEGFPLFDKIYVPKYLDLSNLNNRKIVGDLLISGNNYNYGKVLLNVDLDLIPSTLISFCFNDIETSGKINLYDLSSIFHYSINRNIIKVKGSNIEVSIDLKNKIISKRYN